MENNQASRGAQMEVNPTSFQTSPDTRIPLTKLAGSQQRMTPYKPSPRVSFEGTVRFIPCLWHQISACQGAPPLAAALDPAPERPSPQREGSFGSTSKSDNRKRIARAQRARHPCGLCSGLSFGSGVLDSGCPGSEKRKND